MHHPSSSLSPYRSTRVICFFCAILLLIVFLVTVIFPFWVSVLSGDWVDTRNWDGNMGRNCSGPGLDSTTMPFWSRGFARSCCTSFPKRIVKHYKLFFEGGDLSDPLYFLKYRKHIRDGDILYVAIADLARFIRIFSELPSDIRITLVTGQEDIGAPYEIFHPKRKGNRHYQMEELWAWPNSQRMNMREFLSDKRLNKWYVQNYDLVGCNAFTCSDIDIADNAELVNKVVPIPIGLDFHSMGEKRMANTASKIATSVCTQRSELQAAVSASVPFSKRQLAAYGQFDCALKVRERELTRGELCRLLYNSTHSSHNNSNRSSSSARYIYDDRKSRPLFWKQLTSVTFAFAPPGFGIDTHRLWEILHLHTVPIVISSPLDKLYSQFPVIIVEHWSQAFVDGALERFQSQINERFGDDPFGKADVLEKLTVDYWVKVVHEGASLS